MGFIRLLLAVIIVYLLYRIAREFFSTRIQGRRGHAPGRPPARGEELVQDPCCGVYIPMSQAVSAQFKGETHYFCSRECMEKYRGGDEG